MLMLDLSKITVEDAKNQGKVVAAFYNELTGGGLEQEDARLITLAWLGADVNVDENEDE